MDDPVKVTPLKTYAKDKTGLRVETAAIELLAARLNAQVAMVVERAAVLVQMQGKSTLQDYDMDQAIQETWSSGSGQEPDKLFEVIESYTVGQLGELVQRLRQSLEG